MERSKYQIMRALLFFDLPVEEDYQKKIYTKFRSNLIKLGYTMIQNSVYVKVLNSKSISEQHLEKVKKIAPKQGNVRILILTEKQYEDMKIVTGVKTDSEILNDTKRYRKI